jgi:hypothetical protein
MPEETKPVRFICPGCGVLFNPGLMTVHKPGCAFPKTPGSTAAKPEPSASQDLKNFRDMLVRYVEDDLLVLDSARASIPPHGTESIRLINSVISSQKKLVAILRAAIP